MIIQTRTFS